MTTPTADDLSERPRAGATEMKACLIEPDDRRWQGLLDTTPHDFYHRPDYVAIWAREEGGEARAVLVGDGERSVLIPIVVREIPGGGRDATAPYGYPGPIVTPAADELALIEGLRAARGLLEAEGLVSLFLRSHPLLAPDLPTEIGTVVEHSPTVVVDLRQSDVDWKAGLRKSHRSQIERALADGHDAFIDDDLRHFDRFKHLYHDTMDRVGAVGFYRFSDAYFDDLRTALGDALQLCVIGYADRIWAAGLFVRTAGIVESHLSADDGSHRRGGAKKLMYAHVRDRSKARGAEWLHLGGGGSDDNLLAFKKGFSRDLRPFRTLRIVLRPDHYARLVRERKPDADPFDLTGFFPRYRDRA